MIAKSNIPPLSPVYFPFTCIAPSLLDTLVLFLDQVVLYRPVGSRPMPALQRWIEEKFLDIRIPFEGITDKKALMTEIEQCRTWGLLNRGADTAYLKAVGGEIGPADPSIPRIASEIKPSSNNASENLKQGHLTPQLFLHLAQDFDQHSRESKDQLDQVRAQERALQAFFRMDSPEEDEPMLTGASFTAPHEDLGAFMTSTRMAAWNHLFQKDPEASPILFTDSPAAYTWLLEAVKEKVLVLMVDIPRAEDQAMPSWWKDRFQELCRTLITTPWNDQLQERMEHERREIEGLMENQEASSIWPCQQTTRIHSSLVLKEDPASLLNQRCGLAAIDTERPSLSENALVALVEPRG